MPTAQFTFLPDLNTFLAHSRRTGSFALEFRAGQTLKHLIESAGVPHTEVGRALIDGEPAALAAQPVEGQRVTVLPQERGLAGGKAQFLLDSHLGQLANDLRMLGFDCLYRNDYEDEQLARISAEEDRILLTRDRRLLMRSMVERGYCLRSLDPHVQLVELLDRFDLYGAIEPFRRCLRCNSLLDTVSKEAVLDVLEPLTRQYYDEFRRCPNCGQVYWKGTHYEHMRQRVEDLRARGAPAGDHKKPE